MNLDRILLIEDNMYIPQAGSIMKAQPADYITIDRIVYSARYQIKINSTFENGAKYATLIHELAHLYCGHNGTPNEKWWPDRSNLTKQQNEFEAESVSWLICERAGIKNPSDSYLSDYLGSNLVIPEISLDRILKVAGHIEKMGKRKLKPRKEKEA
jgi:antirestriction protein ArdC